VIPDDYGSTVRHDESLQVLIAYQPLSKEDRDRLIANTRSAVWHQAITKLSRESRRSTACFYGGGGFIFPRWFLQEFPGSTRIDVQRRGHGEAPITYDFIYADAFNDFSIPWHLTTREFLQKTNDLLSDRGVFQANIIDIYPRTEYPGTSVGVAEAEYSGRLPIGVLLDDTRRDKLVPAAKPFSPLEVMELITNRYRLRVPRTLTSAEERKLQQVAWPPVKKKTEFEVSKGFQPEINVTDEKEGWQKAISELAKLSQKRMPYVGTIPEQLEASGGKLEGWVPAVPPFEFVEIYRIGGDQHILGFRGIVSDDAAQKLIQLDPQNKAWSEAVTIAARRSRVSGPGRFMGRYVATAAKIFPNIYLFSTSYQQPNASRDTFVMVCSRQPIDLKSLDDTGDWTGGPFASLESEPGRTGPKLSGQMSAVLALAEGQILTDDFAPVDNLLVPVFMSQE